MRNWCAPVGPTRRCTAFRQGSMKLSNPVVVFQQKQARRRREDELAFLAAALEIVETPPSPIGRAIGATIMAVFVLALAWASFGKVDIVATAPGKVIPSGRSK